MNAKRSLAFVSISALGVGNACAQSNVTLYGIIDTGIQYYNNATSSGGSVVGMPSLSGKLPSRFGLRGVEDLGGGYKAFFVLENGFAVNNGALGYGGRIFGRAANVGIDSKYGTLTLGRQMNMTLYALTDADVIGPSNHSLAVFDTYLPNARSDNAVGYMGKWRGFTLGGTYSFGRDAAGPAGPSATNCAGQVPGDFVACRQYTVMLAYASENFGVTASYDVMRGGTGASAPLSSSADTDTRTIVDGYAKYGNLKLGAGWIRRNTASTTHSQSDIFFFGGTYLLTPAFSVDAQAVRYILRTRSDATLLVGRVSYFLSKRTSVYSSAGYMINSPTSAVPVSAGGTVGTGKNQVGVMVGMQQRF
jgi:predicted porin